MKYFHNVASHNRNRKHVWEIMDGNGVTLTDQGAIMAEAISYYKKFYKAPSIVNIIDQVKVTSLFPKMVSDEEMGPLYSPVTLEELKSILFHFKKIKESGVRRLNSSFSFLT